MTQAQDRRDPFASLDAALLKKLEQCSSILREMKRVTVAFSGGVDSTFLLALAVRTLGRDNVLAVTNTSAIHPKIDSAEARLAAAFIGVEMIEVQGHELSNAVFTANPPERCYYCKHEIFSALKRLASQRGLDAVCSGANADDVGDFRPGAKAEAELEIRRPLLEAGLTKAEIRAASRALGLPTADKPSMACLASRIPYGLPITAERLARIEASETVLRELGLKQYRVRDHDSVARIEVLGEDFAKVIEHRERIVAALKKHGYSYVTLDLQGFRSGSLNETL